MTTLEHEGCEFDVYFVLHGFLNGERGVKAITTCGRLQRDGWYFLLYNENDGVGFYNSRDTAIEEARKYIQTRIAECSEEQEPCDFCGKPRTTPSRCDSCGAGV